MSRSLILATSIAVALAGAVPVASGAQTMPGASLPPLSERAPHVEEMLEALHLYEVLAIMASEGIEAARTLEADMFPGEGGAAWSAEAHRIHGEDRMTGLFEDAFPLDALSEEEVAQVTAFFTAEPGARIADAEVEARRAFLDPRAEDMANAAFRAAIAEGDPRIELLTGFIEANDLVERNVAGALNSNFAFYRGLADGGAFEVEIPEDLMLSEVWAQEPQLRRDTIEWLYSFQLSAYDDLSDSDLEAYVAFSGTEAGQALNAALFAAFDTMFEQLSHELGDAAAGFIAGEDA
ncbi:hypothetical protein P6F26_10210 [Roseibacterium sp. SDUM158017]|uniref:hypothetical protein n=1 Tax=Roseicyclus salinarum TaxID=3036773 RepID=UPI002415001E|nr:hypothetical protein [Roseibacterium sp. SDUM158017]MDG4648816.1 hypothetical protein [Roseibacterium sp. SDUM158017]